MRGVAEVFSLRIRGGLVALFGWMIRNEPINELITDPVNGTVSGTVKFDGNTV